LADWGRTNFLADLAACGLGSRRNDRLSVEEKVEYNSGLQH